MPSPSPQTLSKASYERLRSDVADIMAQAQSRAKMVLARELVVAYWQVGKRIALEELSTKAGYQGAVIGRLSKDLGVDVRTLQRALLFFQTYRRAPSNSRLSWAHYRELLRLRDAAERKWYEQLALEESLTAKQLSTAITEDRYSQRAKGKGRTKRGGKARRAKLRRPEQARYTYKALVEHVVDGDTLLLLFDLGFEVFRQQRVRLAGIDTPPIESPEGMQAQQYVLQRLAETDFVMVQTNRVDVYGRYVGHVFYALKPMSPEQVFKEGRYLNQDLVDSGLARVI